MSNFFVQLFDSDSSEIVPEVSIAEGSTTLIVCGETRPFRFLAKHLSFPPEVLSQMNVVELGCSSGETTVYLTKRFRKVIGLDVSLEMIAKPAGPNLDLRFMDVLSNLPLLKELIHKEVPSCAFFIDVGGDRMQDTVLLLVEHVLREFCPPFIVLKSRKLYHTMKKEKDLIQQWPVWVADTIARTRAERKQLHPKRFGYQSVPGVGGGRAICRYHNYATCKKQDECDLDHMHCHFCTLPGHRAQECEQFLSEILVVRRG